MLRIDCPYCGVRDETEYAFGGPAHVARPALAATDGEWTAYLYLRDNPKGVHLERWCHSHGCGQWFNVARDTVTHAVLRVYAMGEGRPDLGGERAP